MSKIHLTHLMPSLTGNSPSRGIQTLLVDIIVLQAKLENLSNQDFYFQKGKSNHAAHLESLKEQYEDFVETANGNDVDFFLERIREAELKMQKYCSPDRRLPLFAKAFVKASSTFQINYLQELIYFKGKFGTLKPLDELIKNEATLIQIFEL
jgi:hypothetical protein